MLITTCQGYKSFVHRSLNKCSRLAASALRGNLVLGSRIVFVYGFSDALAEIMAEFQKLRLFPLLKLPEGIRIVRKCSIVVMAESGEMNKLTGTRTFELQEIATDQSLWVGLIGRIVNSISCSISQAMELC